MDLNEIEKSITEAALNHFWHWVTNRLEERNLGDIERSNLELDKKRLEKLLLRLK